MKRLTLLWICTTALSLIGKEPALAPAEKRAYHLFSATPRELMREMSTDRPDVTESPHTVDAGHFQIETDLASYTYDRHNPERVDVRVEGWSFLNLNLKAGLWHDTDLQLILPVVNGQRITDFEAGGVQRDRGFGDVTVRLKRNLWGNDGGATALALMPFVKFPTASGELGNGAVEGGLIVPLGVDLSGGWTMGVMAEFYINRDESGRDYHVEFLNSITFSRKLVGELGAYVEFVSLANTESGSDWIVTGNGGFTYAVSEDLQLDAGVNIGLTRAADDVNPFIGVSWRF